MRGAENGPWRARGRLPCAAKAPGAVAAAPAPPCLSPPGAVLAARRRDGAARLTIECGAAKLLGGTFCPGSFCQQNQWDADGWELGRSRMFSAQPEGSRSREVRGKGKEGGGAEVKHATQAAPTIRRFCVVVRRWRLEGTGRGGLSATGGVAPWGWALFRRLGAVCSGFRRRGSGLAPHRLGCRGPALVFSPASSTRPDACKVALHWARLALRMGRRRR